MSKDPESKLNHPEPPLDSDPIRPHVFDGDIREYDKRLPNWWLFTLWGAIAYAAAYWTFLHVLPFGQDQGVALKQEMEANRVASSSRAGVLDDSALWRLSQDALLVDAGRSTYTTTCAACHLPDLSGGIGPNLKDTAWIHGGRPMEIMQIITSGVLEKGMPTWGPVLGREKITEVLAFILSFHKEGEPIVPSPAWVPRVAGVAASGPLNP